MKNNEVELISNERSLIKERPTLTAEQEEVLSNPNVLATFIHLLDGDSSVNEIIRRTAFKPLEASVYLDRMIEVGLVKQTHVMMTSGKSLQTIYKVIEPNLDVSSVVPMLSPSITLDLLCNKVRSDVEKLERSQTLNENCVIKFTQVKVKTSAFGEFKRMMEDMDKFIQEQEQQEGEEEGVTLMLVGYRMVQEESY